MPVPRETERRTSGGRHGPPPRAGAGRSKTPPAGSADPVEGRTHSALSRADSSSLRPASSRFWDDDGGGALWFGIRGRRGRRDGLEVSPCTFNQREELLPALLREVEPCCRIRRPPNARSRPVRARRKYGAVGRATVHIPEQQQLDLPRRAGQKSAAQRGDVGRVFQEAAREGADLDRGAVERALRPAAGAPVAPSIGRSTPCHE